MSWTLNIAKPAQKKLARLLPKDQEKIRVALESLHNDPYKAGIKPLKKYLIGWDKRVGNWRILFDLYHDREHIDIVAIERRTTTTYRKR